MTLAEAIKILKAEYDDYGFEKQHYPERQVAEHIRAEPTALGPLVKNDEVQLREARDLVVTASDDDLNRAILSIPSQQGIGVDEHDVTYMILGPAADDHGSFVLWNFDASEELSRHDVYDDAKTALRAVTTECWC